MKFKLFGINWNFKTLFAMLWTMWGMLTIGSVFIFKHNVSGIEVVFFCLNMAVYVSSAEHFSKYFSK